MPEEGEQMHVEQQSTAGKWILVILAILFVAGSVYGYVTTQQHVQKLTTDLSTSQAQVAELQKRVQSSEAQEETIAQKLGMTKKELMERAAALQAQQKADESRLAQQEKESKEQFGQVTGEVAGVKTDVGGVKTDVASTKADLEATKGKLQSTIGDLGVQSGLIARNHDEVEELKRLGERDIFEFTLTTKTKSPQHIGPIQMTLRRADPKHNTYTLTVIADDKSIEKKDKTVEEPVQFYVHGARAPDEIVVFDISKGQAKGYLSTPKSDAEAPPSTPPAQ